MESEFDVNITIVIGRGFIEVKGNQQTAVDHAITKLQAHLDSLIVKEVVRTSQFISCLDNEVEYQEILASIRQAKVIVGWDIREGKLWLCGDIGHKVNKAKDVICRLITEGVYPEMGSLTAVQRQSVVSGNTWREYKERLSREHPTLHIDYDAGKSKLVFAVKEKDSYQAVIDSLDGYFTPIEKPSATVAVTEDFQKLLSAYKDHVTMMCASTNNEPVDLDVAKNLCVISSVSSSSVCNAHAVIDSMRDNVCKTTTEVKWSAQNDWLVSTEGKNRLEEICEKTKTLASINEPMKQPPIPLGPAVRRTSANSSSVKDKIELVIGDIAVISKEVGMILYFVSNFILYLPILGYFV